MKEKEFKEKMKRLDLDYLNLDLKIEIPVYYIVDDTGEVILDTDSMEEEFEDKLTKLKELTK